MSQNAILSRHHHWKHSHYLISEARLLTVWLACYLSFILTATSSSMSVISYFFTTQSKLRSLLQIDKFGLLGPTAQRNKWISVNTKMLPQPLVKQKQGQYTVLHRFTKKIKMAVAMIFMPAKLHVTKSTTKKLQKHVTLFSFPGELAILISITMM